MFVRRFSMSHRGLVVSAGVAARGLFVSLARVPIAGQTAAGAKGYTSPRTGFGQPDLQGVWANNSATPFERLKEFGDRPLLTDQEVARLQKRANEMFGAGADAAFGDDFFLAALADDPSAANASSR